MKLEVPGPRARLVAAITGGLALLLPAVFHVEHHFPWDGIPGVYAIIGGAGCALLVVVAKWLGSTLVQRPEDWYGPEDGSGEPDP